MDLFLRVESADISLLGGREENQDRVSTAIAEHAALLVVVDGTRLSRCSTRWGSCTWRSAARTRK